MAAQPFDWSQYFRLAEDLAQRPEESALRSALSLRLRRPLPRCHCLPPRPPVLHLALLEGEHARLLNAQQILSRGSVGMFHP